MRTCFKVSDVSSFTHIIKNKVVSGAGAYCWACWPGRALVKGLGSAMGENAGKPDFGLLLGCMVMARGCCSCWPFGVEQCITLQGWVGFSRIRKRCWKQLFCHPVYKSCYPGAGRNRAAGNHSFTGSLLQQTPSPKASPHSCCQGTTSTAPSTAADSCHHPFLLL